MHALAKRALFTCKQVDLLLRDDLSLCVAVNVSSHGLRFDVQTPLWRSEFVISKANHLATLAVFTLSGQVFTVPLGVPPATPQLLATQTPALDPRVNPAGTLVAYVHDGALRFEAAQHRIDDLPFD